VRKEDKEEYEALAKQQKEAYYLCPYVDRCSCNHCPLDSQKNARKAYPGEEECHADKTTIDKTLSRFLTTISPKNANGGILRAVTGDDKNR
jgi:hypothetical protein